MVETFRAFYLNIFWPDLIIGFLAMSITSTSYRQRCTCCRRYLAELCIPVADVMGRPQSALRHSRSTKFPSVQHDKLWPTSIFVRQPLCLELTARTSATNHFNRPFQALSKNVFIRADIALSALETWLFSGLYKFIYLLTIYLYYVADTVLVTIWQN